MSPLSLNLKILSSQVNVKILQLKKEDWDRVRWKEREKFKDNASTAETHLFIDLFNKTFLDQGFSTPDNIFCFRIEFHENEDEIEERVLRSKRIEGKLIQ